MDLKKLLSELTLEEKLGQLTQLNAVFFNNGIQSIENVLKILL